jgi:hypothetical protein
MKSSLLLPLAAALVSAMSTADGDQLFGVYRPAYIDSTTGTGTQSTSVVWNFVNSLARDGQGRLFSVSEGQLVQIDPYALTLNPIVKLSGLGGATGLAFTPDGELFAVSTASPNPGSTSDTLFRIDTATGQTTVVGNTGFSGVQDLACSSSGTLYGWSIASGLITIDQHTGRGTDVNPSVDAPVEIQALAFGVDGTLYGARDALFKIDRVTGIPVEIGSGGYGDIRGLALIPEPPLVGLLAIGLCGLVWVGRMR